MDETRAIVFPPHSPATFILDFRTSQSITSGIVLRALSLSLSPRRHPHHSYTTVCFLFTPPLLTVFGRFSFFFFFFGFLNLLVLTPEKSFFCLVTIPNMIPAYRSMESYPYQRAFPHYYHPGIEAIPPQIKVDPPKPPLSYEQHWPYAANFGHPIAPHFCCGHNNFPCYSSHMPAYPHAPPPMYYSGGFPAYSEPYFVPYPPQPHHTMDLPRYEYDKYMPREHNCCGCANRPCSQKEGTSVKVEELEHDGGKKVNDALVPVQLKNYPYPLVWIPEEYTINKQLRNPNTVEVGEQNKISHDGKPPGIENSITDAQPAQDPRWNGWLPFDIKVAPNMSHDGYGTRNQKHESEYNRRDSEDGKMDQKHQSEHKRSEFPFPIFWLPCYSNNKQEESGKANNQENTSSPKIVEEVPHTVKSVPVKTHVDEYALKGAGLNQVEYNNTGASGVVEKATNARSIPVKQIELHQGENDLEGAHQNVTKKDSGTDDEKRRSTSSPKASKLPPVCLRVDPLPRKKNGSGSSRSPSPPSSKEHYRATVGEAFKTPVCGTNDNASLSLNHHHATSTNEKIKPKERKTIQVSEYKTNENKGVDYKDECPSQINVDMPGEDPKETMESTDGDAYKYEDKKADKGAEKTMEETTKRKDVKDSSIPTDAGQKEGRLLSDADAAVLIQAAYRGYHVRKWEPLKKLKQLDEVRKEVTDVQGRVQAFGRSSDIQNDEKQKIAIGETIMRLLLKLDTLQGLDPSSREIRKSLARELTILQETLDYITATKPQQQIQDFNLQKHVEVSSMDTQNEECVQKVPEEKVAVPGDLSEGIDVDVTARRDNDGAGETQSTVDPASNERAEPTVLLNGPNNEDTNQEVTADALTHITSELFDSNKMAAEPEAKSEATPIEIDQLDVSICEELPLGVTGEERNDPSIKMEEHNDVISGSLPNVADDSACDALDLENHAMMELPVGLLDVDGRDNGMNISKGEAPNGSAMSFEELPVGLLDEDTATSEVKRHDQIEPKTYKEVLLAQEGDCNEDEKPSYPTDETVKETQLEEQQCLEEQEKAKSSRKSDGWVKIEFKSEGDDSTMDTLFDCKSREEVGNGTKLPPLTTKANGDEPGNEDVCMVANVVTNITPEPTESVPVSDVQKEEESEEKFAQRETEEMVAKQTISTDYKDTETLAQKKTELSDGWSSGDSKLLEENEELRKMMRKLLEAGNEQLNVISNLSGRVKDLENKLARIKRVKTKRYRPATSKMICMKSSK
ncbi:hypothetical protein Fmac_010546 [Flemingia macrophylla]|uniref:BAG domain-containing protein n=1 Tax=Flemingia macrophylla TaxID=520843 RepID=A0ABD1MJX3_9FABA